MLNFNKIFRNDDLDAQIDAWGDPAPYQGAEYCLGKYDTVGVIDTAQQRLLLAVSGEPEHGHFEMALVSTATALLNEAPGPISGRQRYYAEVIETNHGPTVFVCDSSPPKGMPDFLLFGPTGRGVSRRVVVEAAATVADGLNRINYDYFAYDDLQRFDVEERAEIAATTASCAA